ncbi:MAG: YqgE/AlgH family protein [Planctomycetales bacterium]|nr:YqgE/AlgH family protein [Planctomycetales bacterium]
MEFLKGKLLIAAPQLADPNFAQTVVLMIEHDENGAFGVVLNRPTGRTVKELWDELAEDPCPCEQRINVGGPVTGPLLAVHQQHSLAEAEIMPGVFIAATREHLEQLVREPAAEFRLFSGYAGWGEGQLEKEMRMGGWITTQATADYIFDKTADLWSRVSRDITRDVLGAEKTLKHFPDDPSVN